jgi:ATP-dependent helicase/nuclease subunit A
MSDKLFPLTHEQHPAVDPTEVVWLSASAGTGKTQVLSARVLRLLLQPDVSPGQVLCLTFTKAGATEMAARINAVLARWVRARPEALAADLKAIGADFGPAAQARARTLFAEVLDCPGGGLRIDTIHAFAQWLLAAFPHEAGLVPGAKAMEDRDRDLLLREVLAELLVEAERSNDVATLDALAELSVRLGADAVEVYLLRCADARAAWFGPGAWQPQMRPRVLQLLNLPSDAGAEDLDMLCSDVQFDVGALRHCMAVNAAWKPATGQNNAAAIGDWLGGSPAARAAGIDALYDVFFTKKDGELRACKSQANIDPGYEASVQQVAASIIAVRERRVLLELADFLVPTLELGRKFALAWDEAKARAGFIDFDDQIRRAAALLTTQGLSDWIRYKLDRRFDHILVDEAQDTNAAQWQIIDALTGEFFAGEGASDAKLRTLFVVGDYKQAIFRFQGTSPENFEQARERVRHAMRGLAENALRLGGDASGRALRELGLGTSFRTAQAILQFVDMAIHRIGGCNFGLTTPPAPHFGEDRPGHVTIWQVVNEQAASTDDADEGDSDETNWLSGNDRILAERIARHVRAWLDDGYLLVKGQRRRASAGDVMVLVRKRKELAGLIVARLHAAGVPVAGVDRLRLAAPLAVRDLMAALRFAAQPLDDLNLACLLGSPLIGWSQDDLLEHGYRERGVTLWEHLRRSRGALVDATMAKLLDLLRQADFEPPQALLHWVLIGPWHGRRKLVARLGSEANDPIDELLNAAGAFAANEVPSLQGFIRWFDAGDGELKREAGQAADEVRVMTVHGSKGLQAPIVILADAADNPDRSRPTGLMLDDPLAGVGGEARQIPLPPLAKAAKVGPISAAEARVKAEELQEHWRLLYVAMTRAEEALYITGALGAADKAPAPNSWYAQLSGLFQDEEWLDDPLWGQRAEHGETPGPAPDAVLRGLAELPLLPPWLEGPPPAEPRPPRPLVPSAMGEDLASDPPYPPGAGGLAARRGVLLHKLLERLPAVPVAERQAAALTWLANAAGEFDAAAQAAMAQSALAVLENPAWAELFSSAALAEVPIAATVGGQVVAGTIDRLLITGERIRLIDFKTARRPPASLDAVPVAILRQMAAYAAALEAAYPGRRVEAAVLYTQTPILLEIPAELLTIHKQALIGFD